MTDSAPVSWFKTYQDLSLLWKVHSLGGRCLIEEDLLKGSLDRTPVHPSQLKGSGFKESPPFCEEYTGQGDKQTGLSELGMTR